MKLLHPVSSFITFCLFVYVCSLGIKNIIRYNGFKLQYADLVSELKKETRLNRTYKNQLLDMKTKTYWETKAREKLGYVKPGETVYKLISPSQKN